MKIMIVEDDEIIKSSLKTELEKWGYEVYCLENLDNVVAEFQSEKPQLVLLDIVLPFFNGYYWCQEIRKISKVPIIFISSKNENMDIVMAMQFGGDDYITKPINLDVTIAKIQAMLRRSYNFVNDIDYLSFGKIQLILSEAKVDFSGMNVDLTKTEMMILESLFKEQGAVVSREKIMDRCWQGDSFIDDNTLAVNVTRLRKKLSSIGLDGLVMTKKGYGYYLEKNSEWYK
ncbi:response regulator transcription factor [Peptostreptococcus porci]|uniref:response regulator transcription factor n=1 Tax=Peptostreptococcus porci TaxID=2652282 RepID=UPI0023F26050|nr:response regulator transcription factor [Peptostreptococcus porci]MDD7182458.1 response regulator transcription factor [Peptostreptococcus porci]MDY4127344.1 response regulator transcription factor [Peptostreptococcus porci]MDY5965058.1 response regulator transcription factor [Peptostreptococcus porci]